MGTKGKNSASEIERGRQHFMDTLQNIPEPIRAMIDYAPGYFEGYLKMREFIYRRPPEGALDLKTKELIYVILDIVTGNQHGAENHLQAAMREGLTLAELSEACMQIIHVCGVTTWGTVGYKVCDTAARYHADGGAELKLSSNKAAKQAKKTAGGEVRSRKRAERRA